MSAVDEYEKHVAKALAHMRNAEPRRHHKREIVKYVEREYADRAIDELKDNYDAVKRHDARAQEIAEEWSTNWQNAQARIAALDAKVERWKFIATNDASFDPDDCVERSDGVVNFLSDIWDAREEAGDE